MGFQARFGLSDRPERPAATAMSACSRAAVTLSVGLLLTFGTSRPAQAQEHPAQRVANIVGVAVEEYAKGVDSAGRFISPTEYQEAVDFLADVSSTAARLSGVRADDARAELDSLMVLMKRHVPPQVLAPVVQRLMSALGTDAALELPSKPLDLAAGRALFESHCMSCHGPRGMGDGPLANTLTPRPPALGTAAVMHDRSPAIMYRIISVGVAGTRMVGWASSLTPDERWNLVVYVNSLRAPPGEAEGQGLYLQRCAACHGTFGASDGALSVALSRLPPDLSSFGWQAEKNDAQLATAIHDGIPGTAMPSSRDLSDSDVEKIVAYVRTLGLRETRVAAAAGAPGALGTARSVHGLLEQALAAARAGRIEEAGDRAFDSYIAFEPLETPARARDPGLVTSLERHFADFKGSIKGNDLRSAEHARDAIEEGLPKIVDLARPAAGSWEAFVQSLVIIVREGFEAILVVGAIVAFLLKTGHRERLRSIWVGVLLALGASGLTAVVLATTLRAIPASGEIIEGVTMLIAVAVLFSVSYWLISKVEAAKWQQFIRDMVTSALERGGGRALAFVAFLAVYREGAETALFYQALFQESHGAGLAIALGLVIGSAALVVIFTLFYRYGVRLPLRPFFAITSALLYYLAFVFMGKGVAELQEGNVVPITVLPGWPHVDAMGIYATVETLIAQSLLVVLFIFAMLRTFWPKRSVTLPVVQPSAPVLPTNDGVSGMSARLEDLEARLAALEKSGVVTEEDRTLSS